MPTASFIGTFSTRGIPDAEQQNQQNQPKTFWFVWEDSLAKSYLIQALDSAFSPAGQPQLLPPKLFHQHFTREPKVTLVPDLQPDIADYLDSAFGSGAPQDKVTLSSPRTPPPQPAVPPASAPAFQTAEPPLSPAEQLDKDLRTEFAQSIMRYRKGNKQDATEVFTRLARQKDGIVPAHKHMFTDFAMDLRKSKLFDLALKHFARAVELSPEDSHANFNMARILYELGESKRAGEYVDKALSLEPDLHYAQILKSRLTGK